MINPRIAFYYYFVFRPFSLFKEEKYLHQFEQNIQSLRKLHPEASIYFFAFDITNPQWSDLCKQYQVLYIDKGSYVAFLKKYTMRIPFYERYPEMTKWLLFSELISLDFDYFFYVDLDVYFFDRVDLLVDLYKDKLGAVQGYGKHSYTPLITKNRWMYTWKKWIHLLFHRFADPKCYVFCSGFMFFSKVFIDCFLKNWMKIYLDYVWRLATYCVIHSRNYHFFGSVGWLKNHRKEKLQPWDLKRGIYSPWLNALCVEEVAFSMLVYRHFDGQIVSISEEFVSMMCDIVSASQIAIHYFSAQTSLFFHYVEAYWSQKNFWINKGVDFSSLVTPNQKK